MRLIALTGLDWPAQRATAELLLVQSTAAGVKLFVATGIEDAEQISAVRVNGHHCELWRVGQDITRPALDALITAHISPADISKDLPAAVGRELAAFYLKATKEQPA